MIDNKIVSVLMIQLELNLELLGVLTSVVKSMQPTQDPNGQVYSRLTSAAAKNGELIELIQELLREEGKAAHGL